MTSSQLCYMGLDAGSASLNLVVIRKNGEILESRTLLHQGKIRESLKTLLEELDHRPLAGAAISSASLAFSPKLRLLDSQLCAIRGAKESFPEMGSLLVVGAEKFFLAQFDAEGKYRRTRSNTSCAAGTGAFLDQQARRLGLSGAAELAEIALNNTGEIPRIASRCSVFAKTDLIHAQQEGFSRPEICDGLCAGMADNLMETLFPDNDHLSPVVFAGGVALNGGVLKHLEARLGEKILVHPQAPALSAWGAALLLAEAADAGDPPEPFAPGELLALVENARETRRTYHHPPLELKLSDYPDFSRISRFDFLPEIAGQSAPVETEVYRTPEELREQKTVPVYLGIDVGSTSTKAALLGEDGTVWAGFYTRTAGQPVVAFQGILEALAALEARTGTEFRIIGTAATGSGRKFLGSLFGADCVMDEISAHARAAYELDPEIDTIIEIGGQDSKFTTMRDGMVTFSQMNTVCAAGTGSFIEEQADRLGVSLAEYSRRAEGVRAPRASDRCTVFMERDIHHYLNLDYSVEEILATVLYSVRENYLQKVAGGGTIGRKVCFQGATAKNKALVAAFEEKLKMPIIVSPYCHLTGALGAALTAREEGVYNEFRRKGAYRQAIPIRQERCELCGNYCRLRIAEIDGEVSAFGFLCGRDYGTKKYVGLDRPPDLLETRNRVKAAAFPPPAEDREPDKREKTVGIPTALQLTEELELWKRFFAELGVPVKTSENLKDPVKRGKRLAGAEFCTPIHALYGHGDYLAAEADLLFLPLYIEADRDTGPANGDGGAGTGTGSAGPRIRKYCYYTQYAPTLISMLNEKKNPPPILKPVIYDSKNRQKTIRELFLHLNKHLNQKLSIAQVEAAYNKALLLSQDYQQALLDSYTPDPEPADIRVVLLGRPYTVLDNRLNCGIPTLLAEQNIETFYMDQLPPGEFEELELDELLSAFHWNYASKILKAALRCARTEGMYPILITSFKCAPDSFLIEYYKRLMNRYEKPYLILQLDDHDSNVGYETRIEAGIRAFRNHHRRVNRRIPFPSSRENNFAPRLTRELKERTIFFPNWDPMAIPLLTAGLRTLGYDARVLEETHESIAESMTMNTGQCIPVNIIAHEYMKAIEKENLPPEDTVLWMIKSQWACNIHLYPYYIKSLMEARGGGMEKGSVFWGDFSYIEFSPRMTVKAYFAYLLSGLLRKVGCSLRPYELIPGDVDGRIEEARQILLTAFEEDHGYMEAAQKMYDLFESVPVAKTARPKVAIFGDLYIRDNPVINQDLVRSIEKAGGEAVITPYIDYIKIIADTHFSRWLKNGRYGSFVKFKGMLTILELMEKQLNRPLEPLLGKPLAARGDAVARLEAFSVQVEQEGESMENLLKITHLIRENPELRLLVQANPAFCCPSLVTEAMTRRIEEITGVPIVTLTYDGTGAPKNEILAPYLKFSAV